VPRDISTSHVERQNLTMRMSMRRFTRADQRFFKEGGESRPQRRAALHALQLLPDSPDTSHHASPMQAGFTDHVWETEELVGLLG